MFSWNISELKQEYCILGLQSYYYSQGANWLILQSDLQN